MSSRFETQNYWFQLPESNAVDTEKALAYLNQKSWVDYAEYGNDFGGYSGIGLTSRSDKPEHVNDSVEVLQSVGSYEKSLAEFDWQSISVWNHNVSEYMEIIFKELNLKPLRARFSKMQPRSTVPRHIDDFSENVTRVHWPIITDDKNVFCFYEGNKLVEKVHMPVGQCFAIDSTVPHGFFNFSKVTERIHLVINFGMNFQEFREWIKVNELFKNPVFQKA